MSNNQYPHTESESLNPARRAAADIDGVLADSSLDDEVVVLDEKLKSTQEEQQQILEEKRAEMKALVGADEAIAAEQVVVQESRRNRLRILVLTRDTSVLQHGSIAQHRFHEYSQMFAEVHVVVLCAAGASANEPDRIASNIWLYPTNSTSWWKAGFDAYRIAGEQLAFVGGFRADIVVSEDPFEAAVAAWFLSKKYARDIQVHVLEDFLYKSFITIDSANRYRLWMASWIFGRAQSVRVRSGELQTRLVSTYTDLEESLEVLPKYYDLDGWRQVEIDTELQKKYEHFKFIMVHYSLGRNSVSSEVALAGAARLLRHYQTVGLIMLIDETDIDFWTERVSTLGLQGNVVFEYTKQNFLSYVKIANVVVQLSESLDEEHMILAAATLGVPIVANSIGFAGELFVDGESAFLCASENVTCVGEKLNRLLNENRLRVQFSQYTKDIVSEQIEQDHVAYLDVYRDSIESCLSEMV